MLRTIAGIARVKRAIRFCCCYCYHQSPQSFIKSWIYSERETTSYVPWNHKKDSSAPAGLRYCYHTQDRRVPDMPSHRGAQKAWCGLHKVSLLPRVHARRSTKPAVTPHSPCLPPTFADSHGTEQPPKDLEMHLPWLLKAQSLKKKKENHAPQVPSNQRLYDFEWWRKLWEETIWPEEGVSIKSHTTEYRKGHQERHRKENRNGGIFLLTLMRKIKESG